MGVDSNLLISSKYNVKDVVKVLTGLGVVVKKEDHKGDHSFLHIELEGEPRTIYVSNTNEYGGLDVTLLSFRSNEQGIKLFRQIAAVVGGMLCENDYDGTFEMIQAPHEGNAYFVLKHTILTKAISSSDKLCHKVSEAVGYK